MMSGGQRTCDTKGLRIKVKNILINKWYWNKWALWKTDSKHRHIVDTKITKWIRDQIVKDKTIAILENNVRKKNLGGFGIGFWGMRPKEWSMQWLVNWASWKWKVSAFQKDFQHSERQAPDEKTIFTEGTPDADCSLSHQVSSWT